MQIRDRLRDKRLQGCVATAIGVMMISASLWYLFQPQEESTPRFLQSRGLEWEVVVEKPIPVDEAQAIVMVFTEQIRTLFNINTYKVFYRPIQDDGIDEYRPEFKGQSSYLAPKRGAITIPLYFVTGFRSDGALGWAWRNPQYFENPNELAFKIVLPTQLEEPKYMYGGVESLPILLHEFGHVMGLKDLDLEGDVEGCSVLRVLMTDNLFESLQSHNVLFGPYTLEGELLINRTAWVRPFGNGTEPEAMIYIEEVYLQNNTIYMNSYDITIDKELNPKVHYHYTIQAFDLDQLRNWWTIEEAAFIGMDGEFHLICPQEFH